MEGGLAEPPELVGEHFSGKGAIFESLAAAAAAAATWIFLGETEVKVENY